MILPRSKGVQYKSAGAVAFGSFVRGRNETTYPASCGALLIFAFAVQHYIPRRLLSTTSVRQADHNCCARVCVSVAAATL